MGTLRATEGNENGLIFEGFRIGVRGFEPPTT